MHANTWSMYYYIWK